MLRRKRKTKSYGELNILNYLKDNKIRFEREYTFNNCRSPKNYLLRFDFYLIDYNILIEYQGQHHYFPVNKKYRAKLVHNKTKLYDDIKKQFCKSNRLLLIDIPYYEKNNISLILDNIIKG